MSVALYPFASLDRPDLSLSYHADSVPPVPSAFLLHASFLASHQESPGKMIDLGGSLETATCSVPEGDLPLLITRFGLPISCI